MMSKIVSIPEGYQEGYIELNSISDKDFDSLIKGLSESSLTMTVKKISSDLEKLTGSDFETILLSVGSVMNFVEKGTSAEELAKNLTEVIVEDEIINFDNPESVEKFTSRLIKLLSLEQLYFASKSEYLITEHGKVFIQARILTDIRPVFSPKMEEPKAAVIVHTLHIHYTGAEEQEHKGIFIALDSNDLKLLKETLNRAETKEISLKGIFEKSGMANLTEYIIE